MPHIEKLFAHFATITRLSGRNITGEDVKDADALLCRSITPVNRTLLQDSNVKFVGAATIGVDHLDTEWLEENNISWANAAGCNAAAVAQYVISAIAYWSKKEAKEFGQLTVGIVGAGNVGGELARCLDILGIQYLLCDPPLQRTGDSRNLVAFEELLNCDVITLHVPITFSGDDKTFHLVDDSILRQLSSQQLLINAARGSVVDNSALLDYLNLDSQKTDFLGASQSGSGEPASVVLDVFENEPNICYDLVHKCLLATPHIAGHTLEGKSRGSYLIYQAFCQFFDLPQTVTQDDLFPSQNSLAVGNGDWLELFLSIYDIQKDSQALLSASSSELPVFFDWMRKNYVRSFKGRPRRDYSGWKIEGQVCDRVFQLFA